MISQKYQDLVERLTVRSEKHPAKFKLQVLTLALFGYFYLYFILFLLLGLIGMTVWGITGGHFALVLVKFGIAVFVLAYIVVKSLWVRFGWPDGIEVSPKKAPELYAQIEEIRKQLGAPTIHHILLDGAWNAAIVQNPRLGPFGWYRNYLILGVPLMQGLNKDEFHSVIAHELAHLSHSHGRFGSWIYRTRKSWIRVLEQLEAKNHWGTFLFRPFFRRFVPRFDAYAFVMARAQEFDADELAAKVTSPDQAGSALIRINTYGLFLQDEFWPSIYSMASEQSHPPKDAYAQLKNAIQTPIDKDKAESWLQQSIAEVTTWQDTHPCLKERLANLQVKSDLPPDKVGIFAADAYLHVVEEAMMAAFSDNFLKNEKEDWKERFQYVQETKKTLSALEIRASREKLSLEEQWEQAKLTEELRGEAEALPLYQTVAETGNLPEAHYAVGRILIGENDVSGVYHLNKAMEQDRHAIIPSAQILCRYYYKKDMEDELDHYYSILVNEKELNQISDHERSGVRDEDRFIEHSLSGDVVQEITNKLQTFPEIKEARLVRKDLQAYPDEPCYVLALKVNKPSKVKWNEDQSKKFNSDLIQRLAAEINMPGKTLFYVVKWEELIINGNLKKVNDAIIYSKVS